MSYKKTLGAFSHHHDTTRHDITTSHGEARYEKSALLSHQGWHSVAVQLTVSRRQIQHELRDMQLSILNYRVC